MNFRRLYREQPFTQIDNGALLNPSLSLKAKGLLGLMMSRPPNWRFNLEWLVKQSRDQKDAVRTGVGELIKHRYVVRVKVAAERGRFAGYEYLVSDTPVTGEDIERFYAEVTRGGFTIVGFSNAGQSDDGETDDGKSNTNNMEGNKTDSNNTETCSSTPQKAKNLDPSVLLPSSLLLGSAVPKTKADPLMLERTLEGAYLFSLKDLRSFSAAHEAAATVITLDPELWRWLVDLKRKGKTDTDTFSSYPEDVLMHVDTYGAERVKAALKYTVQKPGLRNPWTYFLDRVARDIAEPSSSTDKTSSERFSGRDEPRDRASEDPDRYKEPYPGAWDMGTLLATAPTTGDWRKR